VRAVAPLSTKGGSSGEAPDAAPEPASSGALEALLDFWFDVDTADAGAIERAMRRWFFSTAASDRELETRFGALAASAAAGELDSHAATPRGRLALIILLDQLPRNLHRGAPQAFATDERALGLTLDGIDRGFVDRLAPLERMFFLMPLQHAEAAAVQQRSVEAFETLAGGDLPQPLAATFVKTAEFARLHRDIVARFGRFPHRNAILGRISTEAEREFLESGGPSFGQ